MPKTCADLGKNCDDVSDQCGKFIHCGDCTGGDTCGGGGTVGVCGHGATCTPESDVAFCARLGKSCDPVTAVDNCNTSRTANCGVCQGTQTCGGGGTPNVCGTPACVPETDSAFCARMAKSCGAFSGNDNCGKSRAVQECGPCSNPANGAASCVGGACMVSCNAGFNPCQRGCCTVYRSVTAGGDHTCAITLDNKLRCWGANGHGQLGNGAMADSPNPLTVNLMVKNDSLEATLGAETTCVIAADDSLYCWGRNDHGQLGNNSRVDRSAPTQVTGLSAATVEVATMGDFHACAWSFDGNTTIYLDCWGRNDFGQVGNSPGADVLAPSSVTNLVPPVGDNNLSVGVGQLHTCYANSFETRAHCFGKNASGQLGTGGAMSTSSPTTVNASSGKWTMAPCGDSTLAVTDPGAVFGWGNNDAGQLGDGTTQSRNAPNMIGGVPPVLMLACSGAHTCASTKGGQVYCWGDNSAAQLGDGTMSNHPTPTAVSAASAGSMYTWIAAGSRHTCAMTAGGLVRCWGSNNHGQLGDGSMTDRVMAVDVP
jgi:alpha-tubulin suppressor-like RCC1 family protein